MFYVCLKTSNGFRTLSVFTDKKSAVSHKVDWYLLNVQHHFKVLNKCPDNAKDNLFTIPCKIGETTQHKKPVSKSACSEKKNLIPKTIHDQYYVYAIHCKINNRIYIGRTNNSGFRSKNHFSKLRRKRHINKELQSDFNIWKEHNFSFEVIEYCDTLQQSIELEDYWIKKTSSRCYNVTGRLKQA